MLLVQIRYRVVCCAVGLVLPGRALLALLCLWFRFGFGFGHAYSRVCCSAGLWTGKERGGVIGVARGFSALYVHF
jgi:hypothetical protein